MAIFKSVNGQRIQMTPEEEAEENASQIVKSQQHDVLVAYREWVDLHPPEEEIKLCMAKLLSALATSQNPDANDLLMVDNYVEYRASEPPKPGDM